VAPNEAADHPTDGEEGRRECERARGCPGWLVTRTGFVERCSVCPALQAQCDALLSARAAGLDVQDDGFVAGVPGSGHPPRATRSEGHRATVSANDMLIGVLEQLQDVLRLERLPQALRSSVDYLAIEVAKVQGVSEWVAEDLVRLVEEGDDEGDE